MDLEKRKQEFDALVRAIYAKKEELRRMVTPDKEKLALVGALADAEEEIAAVTYDADRFGVLRQYCPPDAQGTAKKEFYDAYILKSGPRLAALVETAKKCAEALKV